jgi:hypothetical protein
MAVAGNLYNSPHPTVQELLEAIFSVSSKQWPHDATLEKLLGEVFSMWSMLRYYKRELVAI